MPATKKTTSKPKQVFVTAPATHIEVEPKSIKRRVYRVGKKALSSVRGILSPGDEVQIKWFDPEMFEALIQSEKIIATEE